MKCGASVGADSATCWKCRDNLRQQPRNIVFSDRWAREKGVFAVRIPIETPQRRLRHGVLVDAGIRAVIYSDGSYVRHLEPGYDPLTSFLQRFTGMDRTGASVDAILAVSDPIQCTIEFNWDDNLYCKEAGRVFARAQLGLRLQLGRIENVHRKYLFAPDAYQVLQDDLLKSARGRFVVCLRVWLNRLSLGVMAEQNYDLAELTEWLRREMGDDLEKCGLVLQGVERFSISPEDLEGIRAQYRAQQQRLVNEKRFDAVLEAIRNRRKGPSLDEWEKRYSGCIGAVVLKLASATEQKLRIIIGTCWVPHPLPGTRNIVVTNAHVVQEMNASNQTEGATVEVIFSGTSEYLPVGQGIMHPGYSASKEKPVPIFDIGIIAVEGLLPRPGLALATQKMCHALRAGRPVASLGFPAERLAGGGTNLTRPQAAFRDGSISKVETWDMRSATDPKEGLLVTHNVPVVGGASGSPLWDDTGKVLAVISAGNMDWNFDPEKRERRRTPSASGVNYAQRIDILLDWLYGRSSY